MAFQPENVENFLTFFETLASHIRNQPGCEHLELWRDARFPNILSTYSVWEDEAALDAYRNSEFFRQTWSQTKRWFAAPPQAFSHTVEQKIM